MSPTRHSKLDMVQPIVRWMILWGMDVLVRRELSSARPVG